MNIFSRAAFGGIEGWFSQILSTCIIWFLGYRIFWDFAVSATEKLGFEVKENEIITSIIFSFFLSVFSTITGSICLCKSSKLFILFLCLGLPFSIYREFVLEQKHGFNKQTPSFYVKDQIKKFVIGQVIQSPILAAIIKIVYWGGDYFFIYLWVFAVMMTLFLMTVYPDFIAPLFDKYTPMPDGQLR